MICECCGEEKQAKQCGVCTVVSCPDCQKKFGGACPQCGSSMQTGAKCSTTGGCGDGRQEE